MSYRLFFYHVSSETLKLISFSGFVLFIMSFLSVQKGYGDQQNLGDQRELDFHSRSHYSTLLPKNIQPMPTLQKGAAAVSEDQQLILAAAQNAISSSSNAISLAEVFVEWLGFMLTLVSAVVAIIGASLIAIFGWRVHTARKTLATLKERVSDLVPAEQNLRTALETLKTEYEQLKKSQEAIVEEHARIRDQQSDISRVQEIMGNSQTCFESQQLAMRDEHGRLKKDITSLANNARELERSLNRQVVAARAMGAVLVLTDPRRDEFSSLKQLQTLCQSIHPIGIDIMLEILLNPGKPSSLRREAAYGLGRYAEDKSMDSFYSKIVSSFENVANSDDSLSDQMKLELVKSIGKFGPLCKKLVPSLIEWSREPQPKLRIASAKSLESIGDNSADVLERLQEMAYHDEVKEVKLTAMNCLKALSVEKGRK